MKCVQPPNVFFIVTWNKLLEMFTVKRQRQIPPVAALWSHTEAVIGCSLEANSVFNGQSITHQRRHQGRSSLNAKG